MSVFPCSLAVGESESTPIRLVTAEEVHARTSQSEISDARSLLLIVSELHLLGCGGVQAAQVYFFLFHLFWGLFSPGTCCRLQTGHVLFW